MGAFSPTCTALHGPSISGNPRSGGCRASRADQVLLRITPSFSARGAAVLGCRAARSGNALRTGCMQCPSCSLSSMLVRKDPESAPLCPQCGDAMRLARKLPPVRPLSGLVVHLCGGCGYVGTAEREPDPPPPKWLRPTRGVRYFPVSCRHSRTPIIRHGRPAKDEADLSSLRGAHEAR